MSGKSVTSSVDPQPLSTVGAYGKAVLHCLKYGTQPVMGYLIGRKVDGGNLFVTDAVPITHTHAASAPHPVVQISYLQVSAVCASEGLSIVGCYVANERLDDAEVSDLTRRLVAHLAAEVSSSSSTSAADKENTNSNSHSSDVKFVLWQFDNRKLLETSTPQEPDASSSVSTSSTSSSGSVKIGSNAVIAYGVPASSIAALSTATGRNNNSSSNVTNSAFRLMMFPVAVLGALKLVPYKASGVSFCNWSTTALKPTPIDSDDSASCDSASSGSRRNNDGALKAVAVAVEGGQQEQLCDFESHLDNPKLDYFNRHLKF